MSKTTGKPGQYRLPWRAERTGYAPRTDRWLYSQKIRAMRNTVAMMHAQSKGVKGYQTAHTSVTADQDQCQKHEMKLPANSLSRYLQEHEDGVLYRLRARQDAFTPFAARYARHM